MYITSCKQALLEFFTMLYICLPNRTVFHIYFLVQQRLSTSQGKLQFKLAV